MSSKEVKIEIQKLLDTVPENILEEILDFLKAINNEPAERAVLSGRLLKILKEDEGLLSRLSK